ncbi:G-protein gamma subunit [Mycena kentingensis (nom. inval.)]|nr:G-protein gamma subunit [Mycena kentingensis (nom. inval.)]
MDRTPDCVSKTTSSSVQQVHSPTMNSRPHKQSMSELKLRRLTEHNQRLREDLARPRVRVSEASASLIRYCKTTKDHLVPSVWGPVGKGEDPYAPPAQGCNCVVM